MRLFACLVGLGLLAACGGGSTSTDPLTLVSSAGVKTSSAKTAKVSEDITIVPGTATSSSAPSSVHGDGAIDFASHSAALTTTVLGQQVEAVIVNGVLFEKIPQLAQAMGGKAWVKLDFNALGKIAGINGLGALAQSGPSDPAQFLAYWKGVGGTVTAVGKATIRGVETTEYHANIDLNKAAGASTNPAVKTALQQAAAALGVSVLPADVWIDAQGRIRRQHQNFDYSHATIGTIPNAALPKSTDVTVDYYDFGAHVTIAPPPADQVTDAASFLGH